MKRPFVSRCLCLLLSCLVFVIGNVAQAQLSFVPVAVRDQEVPRVNFSGQLYAWKVKGGQAIGWADGDLGMRVWNVMKMDFEREVLERAAEGHRATK